MAGPLPTASPSRPSDEAAMADVKVSLDGKKWTDISATVQSVDVEDHEILTDKATIVLDDHTGALAGGGFAGLYVRVAMGWQAKEAVLFDGEVTGSRILGQPDGQKIELTALDFSYRLSRRPYDPAEWKEGERLSVLLKRLVTAAGLADTGTIEPADDAPLAADRARRPANAQNQWQFILEQARLQSCRAYVEFNDKTEKSDFSFVPLDRLASAAPKGSLRYCRGIGDLIQFDYELVGSGATPRQSASTIDPATGELVTEAAPASPPRPDLPPPDTDRNVTPGQRNAVQALAESASAAKARLEPLKGQVTGEAGDPKAAQARVRPDPTRLAGMRGNGVAVGNVQLRTKTRVHIDGIAPWAAGDWYLTKVNHVFSRERINNRFRSSYFTKITATL